MSFKKTVIPKARKKFTADSNEASQKSAQSLQDHVRQIKNAIYQEIVDNSRLTVGDFERDGPVFVSETSMRLTHVGQCLLQQHFEYELFHLQCSLTGRQLIRLKEHCQFAPYYVDRKTVTLFDHKLRFKVALAGDIADFLNK